MAGVEEWTRANGGGKARQLMFHVEQWARVEVLRGGKGFEGLSIVTLLLSFAPFRSSFA